MYQLYEGDCLELLHQIPDQSIDFIFADLPYGTTQNAFDVRIPLNDYIEIEGRQYGHEDYLLWAYRHGIAYKEALAKFRKEAVPGLWSWITPWAAALPALPACRPGETLLEWRKTPLILPRQQKE